MKKHILWIHGFCGRPNNEKIEYMKNLYPQYDIYAIEVDHHAKTSMFKINEYIHQNDVDLVAGTSLGGYYVQCAEFDGPKLIVNPAMDPVNEMRQFIGKNSYKPGRPDGQLEFDFTEDMLMEFGELERQPYNKTICHYTANDPVLGEEIKEHYKTTFPYYQEIEKGILPGHFLTKTYIKEILGKTLFRLFYCEGYTEHSLTVKPFPEITSPCYYEMELWSYYTKYDYAEFDGTEEGVKEEMQDCGFIHLSSQRESIGVYYNLSNALKGLEKSNHRKSNERIFAFIRQKALGVQMERSAYLKEWTYNGYGNLLDESIVRNYDLENNRFFGRPKEMTKFKIGDIVIVAHNGWDVHLGIIYALPPTPDEVSATNDRAIVKEHESLILNGSILDYTDDCYIVLTNCYDYMSSHKHIPANHILPCSELNVPEFVRRILEKGLKRAQEEKECGQ